jgi:hypothetical protein
MSKIAFGAAVVVLIAAGSGAMGRANAQPPASQLLPGAAPPWGYTTTTTTTEMAPTAASPAASPVPASPVPAAQPAQTAETDTTKSIPVNATPMQGMTTPIQAVSLRSGPSTASPVIGTLRPGMPVRELASANYGWIQVETPAGSGWTYGSYLAPGGTATVVQPSPPPDVISPR